MSPVHRLFDDETAQSGIGTLIILIAVILVATMTVGVFFDVAGLLSGETSSTSEDISDQFSGRAQIVAVAGHVSNGTIDRVNITVKPSSGDGVIDLREAAVQWLGPGSVQTYVWRGANQTGNPTFELTTYNGGNTPGVLARETDSATLVVEPVGDPLEEAETVTFTLLTDAEQQYQFRVPDPLPDRSSVGL